MLKNNSVDKVESIRMKTLDFIELQHMKSLGQGVYRFAKATSLPTLYSSAGAIMTRSLYNDLDTLSDDEKNNMLRSLRNVLIWHWHTFW